MPLPYLAVCACLAAATLGCDQERQQECDRFTAAMAPLKQGSPRSDEVDRVRAAVTAIKFQDKPLYVYAKNYAATLTVLSNTLKLEEGASSPDTVPDGANEAIARNLKEARTDADDITRYCSP